MLRGLENVKADTAASMAKNPWSFSSGWIIAFLKSQRNILNKCQQTTQISSLVVVSEVMNHTGDGAQLEHWLPAAWCLQRQLRQSSSAFRHSKKHFIHTLLKLSNEWSTQLLLRQLHLATKLQAHPQLSARFYWQLEQIRQKGLKCLFGHLFFFHQQFRAITKSNQFVKVWI